MRLEVGEQYVSMEIDVADRSHDYESVPLGTTVSLVIELVPYSIKTIITSMGR